MVIDEEMDGYDEDISENPFYKAFISKGKSLYNLAADNRWTVCFLFFGFDINIVRPKENRNKIVN